MYSMRAENGIRDIVFKYHASCYGTQAPIEAARGLAADLRVGDIDHILVEIEPQYLSVCGIASPCTTSEARFSTAHMVTLALLGHDTAGESGFAAGMLAAPDMVQLREKIVLAADEELSRATARITVTYRNGQSVAQCADASKPEQDLESQELRLLRKSSALLAGFYQDAEIAAIQQRVLNLEYESDVAVWAEELSQALAAALH